MPNIETMSNAATSKTTWTVAGSVAGVAGATLLIMQFVRGSWPSIVPWPPDQDAKAVAIIATVIAPLVSRFVAWRRGKV